MNKSKTNPLPSLEEIIDNPPLRRKLQKQIIQIWKEVEKKPVFYCCDATQVSTSPIPAILPDIENHRMIFGYNKKKEIGFKFAPNPKPSFQTYADPHIEYINITPQMAYDILLHHNICNRKVLDNRVRTYAKCIKDNGWVLTGEGISFYSNGMLSNGQHRLWAILLSGKIIRLLVTSGLHMDSRIYIDEGRARSILDASRIVGDDRYSPQELKTAVWMMDMNTKINKRGAHSYRQEQLDFAHKHITTIRRVCAYANLEQDPDKILSLALFRGALVRLCYNLDSYKDYCSCPDERFEELLYVLTTGNVSIDRREINSAAIKIREKKLSPRGKKEFEGNERKNGYYKFESACDHFMKQIPLTRWKTPKKKEEKWLLHLEQIEREQRILTHE